MERVSDSAALPRTSAPCCPPIERRQSVCGSARNRRPPLESRCSLFGRPESLIQIRDTWNTDIVPEFAPQPGDPIVYKHRSSAFHETELDAVLNQLGATHLIVTGGTTSVCVESTIRDAYSRDYSCILLEDCTAEPIGRGAHGYLGVPGRESSPGGITMTRPWC